MIASTVALPPLPTVAAKTLGALAAAWAVRSSVPAHDRSVWVGGDAEWLAVPRLPGDGLALVPLAGGSEPPRPISWRTRLGLADARAGVWDYAIDDADDLMRTTDHWLLPASGPPVATLTPADFPFLAAVLACSSTDTIGQERRRALTIATNFGRVEWTATDGFRLGVYTSPAAADLGKPLLVPAYAMTAALRVRPQAIAVAPHPRGVVLDCTDKAGALLCRIISRVVDAEPYDWRRVLLVADPQADPAPVVATAGQLAAQAKALDARLKIARRNFDPDTRAHLIPVGRTHFIPGQCAPIFAALPAATALTWRATDFGRPSVVTAGDDFTALIMPASPNERP